MEKESSLYEDLYRDSCRIFQKETAHIREEIDKVTREAEDTISLWRDNDVPLPQIESLIDRTYLRIYALYDQLAAATMEKAERDYQLRKFVRGK